MNKTRRNNVTRRQVVHDKLLPLARAVKLRVDKEPKVPEKVIEVYSDLSEATPEERRAVRLRLLMVRSSKRRALKVKPPHRDEHHLPIKYTLFTKPCPYLSMYQDGDEDLEELEPILYDSFRTARSHLQKLQGLWISERWNNPLRASDLE